LNSPIIPTDDNSFLHQIIKKMPDSIPDISSWNVSRKKATCYIRTAWYNQSPDCV